MATAGRVLVVVRTAWRRGSSSSRRRRARLPRPLAITIISSLEGAFVLAEHAVRGCPDRHRRRRLAALVTAAQVGRPLHWSGRVPYIFKAAWCGCSCRGQAGQEVAWLSSQAVRGSCAFVLPLFTVALAGIYVRSATVRSEHRRWCKEDFAVEVDLLQLAMRSSTIVAARAVELDSANDEVRRAIEEAAAPTDLQALHLAAGGSDRLG